jgi:hypothetical protein
MRREALPIIDESCRIRPQTGMFDAPGAVRVSVLMPAYNAERYLLQSVQSVLGQTFGDFELLVVDDCSTDRTPDILASIQDRRMRVIRNEHNLGIVGALNRAMARAHGGYIARIDADDFCLPTRFAKQVAYLDAHPDIALLGTETFILEEGRVRHERQRGDADPLVVRWRSLVSNPIGHPTMMFRAEMVARIGTYLREDYKYAEDFDFSHRLLDVGDLAVLPENLIVYRQHHNNITRTRRDEMIAKTAAVLSRAYEALLGEERNADAHLVAMHLMAGEPIRSPAGFEQLGSVLDRLVTAFLATYAPDEERRARVIAHAGSLWWTAIQASLRAGLVVPAALGHRRFGWHRETRPTLRRLARSAVSGQLRSSLVKLQRQAPPGAATEARLEDPPSLYAVLEVPAGTGTHADLGRAQGLFDAFGLRPIYLVDGTMLDADANALRELLDRQACVLGVHGACGQGAAALRDQVDRVSRTFHVTPLLLKDGVTAARLDGAALVADLGEPAAANPASRGPLTLTPETVSERDLVRMVRTASRRGCRTFTLRWSLGGGDAVLHRIEAVCRFFFATSGGLPGNPADLVPQAMREHLWPAPESADRPTVPNGA